MIRALGWIGIGLIAGLKAAEIDLATALDTPGWSWTATEVSGQRAKGVAVPDARGGAAVDFSPGGEISTHLSAGGILKIRLETPTASIWLDGVAIEMDRTSESIEWSTWYTYAALVPEGGGTLKIVGTSGRVDWVELLKTPADPLNEALDTSPDVVWTTSGIPFTGRPDPEAQGGSAAYVWLEGGEEAVLEAIVQGPGLFDFRLIATPGDPDWWLNSGSTRWSVSIDGREITLDKEDWGAFLVKGEGPHHIRLHFRSTGWHFAAAVDQVSWIPLPAALPATGWTASPPAGVLMAPKGGRNDGPLTLLRIDPGESQWVERTVTGPGLLEWESRARSNPLFDRLPLMAVTIDGSCTIQQAPHEWKKHRLSVPAGTHTVRWSAVPAYEGYDPENEETGEDLGSFWLLSGATFTPGVTPLMQALDCDTATWLETGDAGTLITGADARDSVDAWRMGPRSELYLCNALPYPVRGQGGLFGRIPSSSSVRWNAKQAWIPAGTAYRWALGAATTQFPDTRDLIDTFSMEPLVPTSLAAALELPEGNASGDWVGIASPTDSHDGQDVAGSFLNNPAGSQTLSAWTTGPAKIRFQWKKTGTGALIVKVEDEKLPFQPSDQWSQAEIMLDEDFHINWSHTANIQTFDTNPSSAWVDEIAVTPLPARTLDDVAVDGTPLHLQSLTTESYFFPWKPKFYLTADGSWKDAAKCMSGTSLLKGVVNGPAVMSFRGKCLKTPSTSSGSGGGGSSVDMGGTPPPKHFLLLKVGGQEKAKIDLEAGWQTRTVKIPAGGQEVSWQLITQYTEPNGETRIGPANLGLEGWVDDIALQTPAAHYDAWRIAGNLPPTAAGPDDDADGDGFTNFIEYAWGSDPLSRLSLPPKVSSGIANVRLTSPPTAPAGTKSYTLWIPYLPSHVSGVLEASDDLVNWQPQSPPLSTLRPSVTGGTYRHDTDTQQFFQFPLTNDARARYFRVRLSAPGED